MMEEDFNNLLYKNEALFRFMGIKFTKVEKGYAEVTLDYKEELTRIGGMLHGAIIFASMDYAGSYAVKSLGVKDAFTIQFNILFMKQMKEQPFKFVARVIRHTRKYAYVEIEAYSKGELSAKGSGVWHIINDKE
ncbi:hotdog fold thioesterase [Acidianus sulfidivorans JP7]|uniref:Esterase n=1 Tax=Acidianus sulfidivorans JP7 TaxID=619593 RepID=A0A2U9IJG8_9CREN|nr:PaaI family thioesterase [Acidianus sulfidivorans]AWR96179.1 hotdog fold thioesterase [Acidianus sulfidivorans JP7]